MVAEKDWERSLFERIWFTCRLARSEGVWGKLEAKRFGIDPLGEILISPPALFVRSRLVAVGCLERPPPFGPSIGEANLESGGNDSAREARGWEAPIRMSSTERLRMEALRREFELRLTTGGWSLDDWLREELVEDRGRRWGGVESGCRSGLYRWSTGE
jgi:hypothetical protein